MAFPYLFEQMRQDAFIHVHPNVSRDTAQSEISCNRCLFRTVSCMSFRSFFAQNNWRQDFERNSSTVPQNDDFASFPPEEVPLELTESATTCNICERSADTGEVEIPREKVTPRCTDIRAVCKECMERHIALCLEQQNFPVQCICAQLNHSCPQILTTQEVRKHASPELFARFFRSMIMLQEVDQEFCWHACPDCESEQPQSFLSGRPVVTCHKCGFKSCSVHYYEWHRDGRCSRCDAANSASRLEDVGLMKLFQDIETFRRCPCCRHGIEKSEGCDFILCLCMHTFCWRCLAPYRGKDGISKRGNSAHKPSCIYYSEK